MEKRLHINQIENRQYMLSPAIQSGNDRECINKDFYQEGDKSSVYVGKLGIGMKVVHRKTSIPYTIIHFEKVGIKAMTACVPQKVEYNKDLDYFMSDEEIQKAIQNIGIEERRIADKDVCSSDLCFKAAE